DGSGFQPASGASCTITLTGQNGATPVPAGPFSGTSDGSGHFSATFSSASAGPVIGHASCSKTVHRVALFRQTNGQAGNSGDATKTLVDAKIAIAPDATNEVGQPHTLTLHDALPICDGSGFQPASGASCTITLTGQNGATPVPAGPFSGT